MLYKRFVFLRGRLGKASQTLWSEDVFSQEKRNKKDKPDEIWWNLMKNMFSSDFIRFQFSQKYFVDPLDLWFVFVRAAIVVQEPWKCQKQGKNCSAIGHGTQKSDEAWHEEEGLGQGQGLGKAKSTKLSKANLEKLDHMSLKEKIQAATSEAEDVEAAAELVKNVLFSQEKSQIWGRHQTALKNSALEKVGFDALSKKEKGVASALWLLQTEGKKFIFANRFVNASESGERLDDWQTEKEMLQRFSENEVALHIQSGRVVEGGSLHNTGRRRWRTREAKNGCKAMSLSWMSKLGKSLMSSTTKMPCTWPCKIWPTLLPRVLDKALAKTLPKGKDLEKAKAKVSWRAKSCWPLRTKKKKKLLPSLRLRSCKKPSKWPRAQGTKQPPPGQTWKKPWKRQSLPSQAGTGCSSWLGCWAWKGSAAAQRGPVWKEEGPD